MHTSQIGYLTLLDVDDPEQGRPPSPAAKYLFISAYKALIWMLNFVLPSWLWSHLGRAAYPQSTPPKKPRPTAYLDGLRGVVSVLVFVRHFLLPWQPHLDYGYGMHDNYHGVFRLPFLRLLFSGPLVPVFFVVSGYVLSARPLALVNRSSAGRKDDRLQQALMDLARSTFRRPLRLFLPPLVSTFGVMLLAGLGAFAFDYGQMPGRKPTHPVHLGSWRTQLWQWAQFAFAELTNPWRWDVPVMLYGPHLWSIPVSFQGSLVVFLSGCLVLTRRSLRITCIVLLMLALWLNGRYHMAPFLGGMLLCEWDLAQVVSHEEGNENESKSPSKFSAFVARLRLWLPRAAIWLGLICGLYMGSFPRANDHGQACVAGYDWFCAITPNYHYWHSIGALMVMVALARSKVLQWPLESAVAQYLGSVSFSLYIVHEPFLHLAAFYAVPLAWHFTGQDNQLNYQAGLLLAMVMCLVVLVWLADLFKAYVEVPCTKLSARLEKMCVM